MSIGLENLLCVMELVLGCVKDTASWLWWRVCRLVFAGWWIRIPAWDLTTRITLLLCVEI